MPKPCQLDMDVLKGKLLLFGMLLGLVGCSLHDSKKLEHRFGIDFQNSLVCVLEDECWCSFNGNGEKVVYYEISNDHIQEIKHDAKEAGFVKGDSASLSRLCSERECRYLHSDEFLYKTMDCGNETYRLIVDFKTGHLIYYYAVQ